MNIAIRLSEENLSGASGGPFGAVIVKNNEVVAQSANTVIATTDPTAHAEIAAIRLACKALNTHNLAGCIIYTSCEPCPMCLSAIYWAGLDAIYYANTRKDAANIGFDDEAIYNEIALDMADRKLPFVQILHAPAQEIFKKWQISGQKI